MRRRCAGLGNSAEHRRPPQRTGRSLVHDMGDATVDPANQSDVAAEKLVAFARRMLDAHLRRSEAFGVELAMEFGDPAYDMLALYVASAARQPISVTSVCAAAGYRKRRGCGMFID